MRTVVSTLNEALQHQKPVALATMLEVTGASPAQVGFKLLVLPDGSGVGSVGGGALERQVREDAMTALREDRSRLVHYSLREEGPDAIGMLCGGDVTVFIDVCQPAPVLLIAGGGHIGQPLRDLARIVGFHVIVVDVQADRATVPQFDPTAITARTFVVVITENHLTDQQVLRQVLDTRAAYVGMIGSQRKVETVFDHLRADGVGEDQVARVHAPVGLNLGGRGPAEIALAVLAEILQVRYHGTGKSLASPDGNA
jgi:xanthine dehydrogenase accessory factor